MSPMEVLKHIPKNIKDKVKIHHRCSIIFIHTNTVMIIMSLLKTIKSILQANLIS